MGHKTVLIQEMTWPEYQERVAAGAPILLGIGATEQHGPHLPLGTDALLSTALLQRAAPDLGALVAPTVAYGAKSQPRSGGGQHFPGTASLDAVHLIGTIRDVVREFVRHGCRKIAILNGHLENQWYTIEAIDLAMRDARTVGADDLRIVHLTGEGAASDDTLDLMFPEGFPGHALEHAARIETSMMAYLYPELVRDDLVPQGIKAADFPQSDVYPYELMPVPPTGVLAPAEGYSVAFGERLTGDAVRYIVKEASEGFAR